jgi:hypothetical protein
MSRSEAKQAQRMDDGHCSLKNECRYRKIAVELAEENLKLKNDCTDQKAVIQNLKTEIKMRAKAQVAENRARDRKDMAIVFVVVGSCILYAVCALFVMGFV